jgi:hypothetical protein
MSTPTGSSVARPTRLPTARKLKRYEFLMTFAPLPVEGGTGSPLNPLAIF